MKELEMKKTIRTLLAIALAVSFFGCSEPLTTREKGAAVGTLGGAGLGAIIGSATGNAGAGGALIGDQLQARQKQDEALQQQLSTQQAEIERQKRELEQLKQRQEY
jgi:hypothetical protein